MSSFLNLNKDWYENDLVLQMDDHAGYSVMIHLCITVTILVIKSIKTLYDKEKQCV